MQTASHSVSQTIGASGAKIDGMMCGQNVMYASIAAGAAVAFLGLDNAISVLPREVHWGLAGLLVSTYCQSGTSMPSQAQLTSTSSLYSIGYGLGGGFAIGFIGR
jgi:hypothetical protein